MYRQKDAAGTTGGCACQSLNYLRQRGLIELITKTGHPASEQGEGGAMDVGGGRHGEAKDGEQRWWRWGEGVVVKRCINRKGKNEKWRSDCWVPPVFCLYWEQLCHFSSSFFYRALATTGDMLLETLFTIYLVLTVMPLVNSVEIALMTTCPPPGSADMTLQK